MEYAGRVLQHSWGFFCPWRPLSPVVHPPVASVKPFLNNQTQWPHGIAFLLFILAGLASISGIVKPLGLLQNFVWMQGEDVCCYYERKGKSSWKNHEPEWNNTFTPHDLFFCQNSIALYGTHMWRKTRHRIVPQWKMWGNHPPGSELRCTATMPAVQCL